MFQSDIRRLRPAVYLALAGLVVGVTLIGITGDSRATHNSASCGTINGTNNSETVDGTSGCEDIFAKDGSDTVHGFDGLDDVHGENGHDLVYGGGAADWPYGGDGNDRLDGGDGDDIVHDNEQTDTDDLCGGAGSDGLDAADHDSNDDYYYAPSVDVVTHEYPGTPDDNFKANINCPF